MHSLGVIIATKDRPDDLRRMLRSVRDQTVVPDQVIIVDASSQWDQSLADEFAALNIRHLRHWPPSAAAQRNAGLAAVDLRIHLIAFMDDDIVLEPDAIQKMLEFWDRASPRVGGAAFNWLNPSPRPLVWLKKMTWMSRLGLYPAEPGGVAPSGWQAATGTVTQNTRVNWLPSGASVWRREVFRDGGFDPYFEGYSYLEDLDFSYSVGQRYELFIVADAGFRHYPAKAGRIGKFEFGRIEVANRLYLVRKHHLSQWRCMLGIGIRLAMTLLDAVRLCRGGELARAAGNAVGLVDVLILGSGNSQNGQLVIPARMRAKL